MLNNISAVSIDELKTRPALFVDFDGTIRGSKAGHKFIKDSDDIVLLANTEEYLWKYRNAGYLICGITNQGGVAFGIRRTYEVQAEIEATFALFEKNPFHMVETCFHHPQADHPIYGHESLLRKPNYGMLVLCELKAFQAGYIIDWKNSLMVGDRDEDEQCAHAANIGFKWAWEFFGRPE